MDTNTTRALELLHLTSGYDGSEILQDVSFSLPPASVLALLGRNGAGKTTCINTIVGITRAMRGQIRLFGKPVTSLPVDGVIRSGIAVVPQGRRLFSLLSVKENLLVAQPAQPPHAGPRWSLDQIVAMFPRLGERFSQRAGTLSGGEQQMLAIGRALMASPRVLLLDEPSEGLSPQMVAEVAHIIARLREAGLAILLVEQNSRLALSVAQNAVVLSSGRIVFSGPATELAANGDLMACHLGVRASEPAD
ncbi:ABC transporter ATP-binding protein [Cupriavidus basilensis]|uniref:Branched-chain amino acid transport ATP-binding protein LivF n=1 Tax=Cupriavidus basilensis TaxID=68895 RepID=A0A0C4Y923_9BURK|nr:ABC transporter ATP-binding protein [Cupriavidus basilensis]AJG19480.1 Branched-chain amino acid transport ATP-binding protein LivF [Cupriavidus basilensis]